MNQTMDFEQPDEIRSALEIARRALTLFGVVAVALGADRGEIISWLKENGLFEELSPREARFVDDPTPSKQQVVDASWYSERLVVLLWALDLVSMPLADEQCDTGLFQKILPPYAEIGESDFIKSAKLRNEEELIDMADRILDQHWEARDAKIHDREPRGVDLGIIQERHHAISWVIGYDGLPWDSVTTDT